MTIDEKIAGLEYDVSEIKRMQEIAHFIVKRNNEEGEGLIMVLAAEVLLREAVMHYEEEIATLKGPAA